jgi:Coenzyme PQQ synthesis protein D (PqqD)
VIWQENSEHVVSDLIEGEMMLLNLKFGHYYALEGCAVGLWPALKQGTTTEQLLEALVSRFPDLPVQALAGDLQDWMAKLQEEELIVEADGVPGRNPEFDMEYQPPGLDKYTDLEDLFLLDPIHDADPERGWPAQ